MNMSGTMPFRFVYQCSAFLLLFTGLLVFVIVPSWSYDQHGASCPTKLGLGSENFVPLNQRIRMWVGNITNKVHFRQNNVNVSDPTAHANTANAVDAVPSSQHMNATETQCADGCITARYTYACCYKLPEVNYTACANVTYLPENYGFNFTITLGKFVFWEEVSLRNPPPLCIETPYLPHNLGELCVAVNDITVTTKNVHFCVKFIFELLKHVYEKELGCVNIPVAGKYRVIVA